MILIFSLTHHIEKELSIFISDEVESHDLDTSSNASSSSFTSSKASLGRSLQLFGQLSCRLAVTPYSR